MRPPQMADLFGCGGGGGIRTHGPGEGPVAFKATALRPLCHTPVVNLSVAIRTDKLKIAQLVRPSVTARDAVVNLKDVRFCVTASLAHATTLTDQSNFQSGSRFHLVFARFARVPNARPIAIRTRPAAHPRGSAVDQYAATGKALLALPASLPKTRTTAIHRPLFDLSWPTVNGRTTHRTLYIWLPLHTGSSIDWSLPIVYQEWKRLF